ncbi:MAG: amino acid ABC transporter permease [Bacillus thermozeamaize]|jgi:L-cystine transport system permease protein|uniref:Amino acid ABC transporter permease n=1 Tax=Bacillus thermozeamaize TaxID=230954 RepID=A0A1Y3PF30_9BACI|nr:MAG: amino acid ABC transporter permease [Bacillus thermozeamaize]
MGELFDWGFMVQSFPEIVRYLPVTLGIAVISMIFGLFLGFLTALVRFYQIPVLNRLAVVYVSFIRGTPLLVQIYLAYYGIPKILGALNEANGWNLNVDSIPALFFVYLTCSVNVGAYLSESIRSALLSVDKGQIEAAYAIGMTSFQAMRRIILPQALVVAFPNFGNLFISLVKDTSLAFIISVVEIMGAAKIVGARGLHFFEVYIVAALIYWFVCFLIERMMLFAERRLRRYEREIVS